MIKTIVTPHNLLIFRNYRTERDVWDNRDPLWDGGGVQGEMFWNILQRNDNVLMKMNAGDKASAIFGDLDIDGNGEVDEEEFIRYYF